MLSFLKEKLSKSTEEIKTKITGEVVLTEDKLEDLLHGIELALLECDVALETAEKVKEDLKKKLEDRKVKKENLKGVINAALKELLSEIFLEEDLTRIINAGKKPFVILFVGVNGSGKTTTIAKFASYLSSKNISSVIAACDTFRAGAIEQLEKHTTALGIRIIKHKKGADPAAVAYDAIESAKAKGNDVVLIDTAGRAESNKNLMEELKKIARVTKPDMVIFVGDALVGNSILEQISNFAQASGIDGVILTKADADAKGGAALSIAISLKKPIFFLGTGQSYGDLVPFRKSWFMEQMGLNA